MQAVPDFPPAPPAAGGVLVLGGIPPRPSGGALVPTAQQTPPNLMERAARRIEEQYGFRPVPGDVRYILMAEQLLVTGKISREDFATAIEEIRNHSALAGEFSTEPPAALPAPPPAPSLPPGVPAIAQAPAPPQLPPPPPPPAGAAPGLGATTAPAPQAKQPRRKLSAADKAQREQERIDARREKEGARIDAQNIERTYGFKPTRYNLPLVQEALSDRWRKRITEAGLTAVINAASKKRAKYADIFNALQAARKDNEAAYNAELDERFNERNANGSEQRRAIPPNSEATNSRELSSQGRESGQAGSHVQADGGGTGAAETGQPRQGDVNAAPETQVQRAGAQPRSGSVQTAERDAGQEKQDRRADENREARAARGAEEKGETREVEPSTPGTRILFEVAPDPNNVELTERWRAMSDAERQAASERIAKEIVPQAMDDVGAQGEVQGQFGGYLDDTNPSFALVLADATDAAKIIEATKRLGYVLSQDSMMTVAPTSFKGSEAVESLVVRLPEDSSIEFVREIYDKLRQIEVKGTKPIEGHTTVGGAMAILVPASVTAAIPIKTLATRVALALGGKYTVVTRQFHAWFPSKEEYNYGEDNSFGPERSGAELASVRNAANNLRDAATALIAETLDAADARRSPNTRAARKSEDGVSSTSGSPDLPVSSDSFDETVSEPEAEPSAENAERKADALARLAEVQIPEGNKRLAATKAQLARAIENETEYDASDLQDWEDEIADLEQSVAEQAPDPAELALKGRVRAMTERLADLLPSVQGNELKKSLHGFLAELRGAKSLTENEVSDWESRAEDFEDWIADEVSPAESTQSTAFQDEDANVNLARDMAEGLVSEENVEINSFDPPYSRSKLTATGKAPKWMTLQRVAQRVASQLKRFARKIPVVVLQSSDLAALAKDPNLARLMKIIGNENPSSDDVEAVRDILSRIKDANRGGRPKGFVSGGRVFLVSESLTTPADILETLWHELLHYGVRSFLPPGEYRAAMNRLYNTSPDVRATADAWLATGEGQALSKNNGAAEARTRAIEEALAQLAERTAPPQGFINTVKRWLANLARRFGFFDWARKLEKGPDEAARAFIESVFRQYEGGPNVHGSANGGTSARSAPVGAGASVAYSMGLTPTEAEVKAWRKSLESFLKAAAKNPRVTAQIKTPAVLQYLGEKSKTITISGAVARKIAEKHRDVPLDVFLNLPALLHDPLFAYPHKYGSATVIVDAVTAKGEPIVVAVRDGEITTITPQHEEGEHKGWEVLRDRMEAGLQTRPGEAVKPAYARDQNPVNDEAPPRSGASATARFWVVSIGALFRNRRNVIQRKKLVNDLGETFYSRRSENKGAGTGAVEYIVDPDSASFKETERAYGGRAAYDRVKTAGGTKLNYEQWVQVRTPEFKEAFGDWEPAHDLRIRKNSLTRAEALESIEALRKRSLLNLETGITAQINSSQATKLISGTAELKSIANGFTAGQHNAVAANIENLWKHATLVESRPPRPLPNSAASNLRSVKRFAAPFILDGETGYAWLTAKESILHGHRVYSIELQELKALRSSLDESANPAGSAFTPIRSAEEIVASLDKKINLDAVSVELDPETGEPLANIAGSTSINSNDVFFSLAESHIARDDLSTPTLSKIADGINRATDRFVEGLGKYSPDTEKWLRQGWDAVGVAARKSLNYTAFTNSIIDIAESVGLTKAREWGDLVRRRETAKTHNEGRIDEVMRRVDKLDGTSADQSKSLAVWGFVLEATMNQKVFTRYDWMPETVKHDPDMARRYKAFSPEQRASIDEIFQINRQLHEEIGTLTRDRIKQAVEERIQEITSTQNDRLRRAENAARTKFEAKYKDADGEVDTDTINADELDAAVKTATDRVRRNDEQQIKRLRTEMENTLRLLAPKESGMLLYAPLQRVGSHVVIAKSQDFIDAEEDGDTAALDKMRSDSVHYNVAFRESQAAANELARGLAGSYDFVEAFEREEAPKHAGIPVDVFKRLADTLTPNTEDENGVSTERNKMLNLLTEMYIQQLADSSARKSDLERRNVPGMDADSTRQAFAAHGMATARYIASLSEGEQERRAFAEMRTQAREPGTREKRMPIFNALARRKDAATQTYSTLVNGLLRGTSFLKLMTKPAFYVYNLTQPVLFTQPYLMKTFGGTEAWQALGRAFNDTTNARGGWSKLKEQLRSLNDPDSLPEDVRAAIRELVDQGRIDITITQDLGARVKPRSANRWARTLGLVDDWFSTAMQRSEMVNRIVTGIAAYRLQYAKSFDSTHDTAKAHAEAVAYAGRTIDMTQGDYSNFNAPPLFNANGFARVATQFRKFQLIQVTYAVSMFRDAFLKAGLSKTERRYAQRAFLMFMANHMALAGAMGLPAMGAFAAALSMAFGDDDDPFDLEDTLHEALGGGLLADVLVKGAPAAIGIDMSSNVGAADMFDPLPFVDADVRNREDANEMVVALAGPSVGMGGNLPFCQVYTHAAGYSDWADGGRMMIDLRVDLQVLPHYIRHHARTIAAARDGGSVPTWG
jgi:hypothetical protein